MVERSLIELGQRLREAGYAFVTTTPESHRRVLAREARPARDLRDVFGWSRPFAREVLPPPIAAALEEAGALVALPDGRFASRVRYSTLDGAIFVHSAYPTSDPDSVFFGPDTYRYCAFLRRSLREARRVVDVGCGSGAGGLVIAERAQEIVLTDVNARALSFARVNVALAGLGERARVVESDVLRGVDGAFDAVMANPPYLVDGLGRTYRDGGASLGTGLALRIVDEAIARLPPGGRILLYTGSPIVDGEDPFRAEVARRLDERGADFAYTEIDVDVFGEELSGTPYRSVDRIALVTLDATLR